MAEKTNKAKLFLAVALFFIIAVAVAWLAVRSKDFSLSQPQDPVTSQDTGPTKLPVTIPDFLKIIPPADENGDHSTIFHGHDTSSDQALSNIVHPGWLEGDGCNLFDLGIYDADCDGIPNWLEEYHQTGVEDPESPYAQGAWNYDLDGVIHGMDGHYSCDLYPTLLNCDARTTSNDETITETQNTDGGCVPDVVEIVRGTNPLDASDDHSADIFGRTLPESRCAFNETTLNNTPLSDLPPLDELGDIEQVGDLEGVPALGLVDPLDFDIFDDDIDNYQNEIDLAQDFLDDYLQPESIDTQPFNDQGYQDAYNGLEDFDHTANEIQTYLDGLRGFADQGFDSYAISDETFTVSSSAGGLTQICEQPGPMYIPYIWDPTPSNPQDFNITVTDEAGNTSTSTIVEDVTIDNDMWVTAIDRSNPTNQITDQASVTFQVFFNYAVSNVDIDDFVLRTTGSLEGEIASVTNVSNQSQYEVVVDNLVGEGMLQLDFGLVVDIDGPDGRSFINPRDFLISRQSYIVDRVTPEPPTVFSPAPNSTIPNPGFVAVNCPNYKDMISVGFNSTTITRECESAGVAFVPLPIISSATPQTITVSITDQAGHVSQDTIINNVSFDDTLAGFAVSRIPSASLITNQTSVEFEVSFSKPVFNVDLEDFVIVKTGDLEGQLGSLNQTTPTTFRIVVPNLDGSGLVTLHLTQDHDITYDYFDPVSTNIIQQKVDDAFVIQRQIYRVDTDIPETPAVIRPTSNGTSGNPTGVVVDCKSGARSFGYEPLDLVFEEYTNYITQTFAQIQEYQQYTSFVPLNEWRTRHDVQFIFDLQNSTWDQGVAIIRGWVDTQGLRIRPELRYTKIDQVAYVEQFRRYCVEGAEFGFEQVNFEDGGWFMDILVGLFNLGQYGRSPVYAYYTNPQGGIELDDVIETPPGVKVPFVVTVPYDDPDIPGLPPASANLQSDGLYAFAIVDPEFIIPLDISISVPIFGDIDINIGLPIPDPTGTAASFIFTGPGCFDMFNSPVPILTLDLEQSTLTGGFNRPQ